MMLRSLRSRLTLWYGGTLALVLLLFGALVFGLVQHRMTSHQDAMLLEKASQVKEILNDEPDCHVLTRTQLEGLEHLGQIILIHDSGGQHEVFYRSEAMQINPSAPTPASFGWQAAPYPVFQTFRKQGRRWRVLSEPYEARSGRRGIIRVMDDQHYTDETLEHLRLALALLIPAAIVCATLGGLWLAGRALAPVDSIGRMAREIEAKHLDRRLPHPGSADEIGRLVDTLNHMIGRLERSFLAMRRFTADASHELRNPLATMRNTIDVVRAQPRSAAEQDSALESLGEDVDRLRRIVEDLLLLARADDGRLVLSREPLELDQLAQAMAETYQGPAQDAGVELRVATRGPARVAGDERWLCQLLGNLLDNALKFTPPGGAITVEVRPGPGSALLEVHDSGPGIPPESLDRVFERFYQADPSRVRTDRPGSGLGLAIVAWIVESHGGRISAANHPEGGAVFRVDLPLLREPPAQA